MNEPDQILYDVAIIGGGLAGLSLSIQLAKQGYSVILFEKERYPFHKVCGEYISLESWDFLNNLGVDLDRLRVPIITRLELSSASGTLFQRHLPLGGFGISRYVLDGSLATLAHESGVILSEGTKVTDIVFEENEFSIHTSAGNFISKVACGTYGKRSNIDIKWKRPFATKASNRLNNYIGVKYHVLADFPSDTIALHNFSNGYCGLVKIEGDRHNLCYLTTAENLKKCNGDFREMEKTILSRNPRLREIFERIHQSPTQPQVISQISFDKKSQVENHVLMVGDAAGMITPLCGNGMSMALHGSRIAAIQVHHFLEGNINREKMEKRYAFH